MATELREDSRYHEIDTIFWSSALAFGMSDRKNPSEALRSPIIGVVELASIGTSSPCPAWRQAELLWRAYQFLVMRSSMQN
jgi:hypothetical protein